MYVATYIHMYIGTYSKADWQFTIVKISESTYAALASEMVHIE